MDDSSFVLEVQSKHLVAMVLINGSVVFDGWDARPRVAVLPLSPWITEVSRLEVFLAPLSPEPRDLNRSFLLRFCRPGRGTGPKAVNTRLAYQWTPDAGGLEQTGLTRVVDHTFRFPRPERGPWDGATPYRDDQRAAIDALYLRAREAFTTRDVGAMRALLARKIDALAPAFGQARDDLERELLNDFAEVWAAPDFRVEACAPGDLVVDRRLGGRLVHLRDRSGRPPLFAHGRGFVAALPLAVSFVDDAWVVVR